MPRGVLNELFGWIGRAEDVRERREQSTILPVAQELVDDDVGVRGHSLPVEGFLAVQGAVRVDVGDSIGDVRADVGERALVVEFS